MENIQEIILQQLQYLINPESDLPSSVLLFGITESKAKALYEIVNEEFNKIKAFLQKRRSKEFNERISKEGGLIIDKYSNLKDRYIDYPEIMNDIYEWESDAYNHEYRRVMNQPTKLLDRLDIFSLIEFNVRDFYKARDRHYELNETLDFTNLRRAENDKEFARYYNKTSEEREYDSLCNFTKERMFAKYAFLYNIVEPVSDPYKLRCLFEPFIEEKVNWSVICFEPNHEYWCKDYDEEFRSLLYSGRLIYDNAENITPIENRIKEVLDRRKIPYMFQYKFGPYTLDFYFDVKGKKLNVECDGKEFHSSDRAVKHDYNRNKYMMANGISVMRFSGSEIWRDAEKCVSIIYDYLSK